MKYVVSTTAAEDPRYVAWQVYENVTGERVAGPMTREEAIAERDRLNREAGVVEPHRITEVFVFACQDTAEGDEGVPAVEASLDGKLIAMPLIGTDQARVDDLRAAAQEAADVTGRPVKLLRFSGREEIESIEPIRSRP